MGSDLAVVVHAGAPLSDAELAVLLGPVAPRVWRRRSVGLRSRAVAPGAAAVLFEESDRPHEPDEWPTAHVLSALHADLRAHPTAPPDWLPALAAAVPRAWSLWAAEADHAATGGWRLVRDGRAAGGDPTYGTATAGLAEVGLEGPRFLDQVVDGWFPTAGGPPAARWIEGSALGGPRPWGPGARRVVVHGATLHDPDRDPWSVLWHRVGTVPTATPADAAAFGLPADARPAAATERLLHLGLPAIVASARAPGLGFRAGVVLGALGLTRAVARGSTHPFGPVVRWWIRECVARGAAEAAAGRDPLAWTGAEAFGPVSWPR